MKTELVTEYVANDGSRFRSKSECESHENEVALVAPTLAKLPVTPGLGNDEFVQHDKELLLRCKRNLFALVLVKYGDRYTEWKQWNADKVHPASVVGRVMSESDGQIAKAWNRLAFYNFDLGREYNQPYFANNPSEATREKTP